MACAAIAEAKNNLPKLVHEAESGTPVQLERHGKPVAVIISFKDYTDFNIGSNTFSRTWRMFRHNWQDFLAQNPEEEDFFENLRQEDEGRTVEL